MKFSVALHTKGISIIKVIPDQRMFFVGDWNSKIRAISIKKPRQLIYLEEHKQTINTIEILNNHNIICGSKDGKISLWKIDLNRKQNSFISD